MRSLWDVIDLQLNEATYGRFDARTGHGYGAVPGGRFSATGGPGPVNTANQANSMYPYLDPDLYEDEETEESFDDPELKVALLTKIGAPARHDDPAPPVDKRFFVGDDFWSVSEGPGRSAPYPPQAPIDSPSKPRRLYKNRGPAVGGVSPKMGRQSMGPHTYGSFAGWTGRPIVRFDLDDFVVYRLADIPNDDQRAVMRAAKRPDIVEK
jgi:hypothetical protein